MVAGYGYRLYPWKRCYSTLQFVVERMSRKPAGPLRVVIGIPAGRQLKLRLKDTRRIESRVHLPQSPEAANQHPCSCHQHHRERQFADHQTRAEPAMPAPGRGTATCFALKRRLQVDPRGLKRVE